MAQATLLFFLFFLPIISALDSAMMNEQKQKQLEEYKGCQQRTWCVAKPSTEGTILSDNIRYACTQVDCSILQKNSPCFYPDNEINHASIVMNLYYQTNGRKEWNCKFGNSGLITYTDPSYGSCIYA